MGVLQKNGAKTVASGTAILRKMDEMGTNNGTLDVGACNFLRQKWRLAA